jgi:hypothetical protein
MPYSYTSIIFEFLSIRGIYIVTTSATSLMRFYHHRLLKNIKSPI